MAHVPIWQVGTPGVVTSKPGYELPPEALTRGENVRTTQDGLSSLRGETDQAFANFPAEDVYWIHTAINAVDIGWVWANTSKLFYYDGAATHTDVSRTAAYTGGAFDPWVGTWLGGVLILNNGVDVPQFLVLPGSPTNPFADLTNWPATYRCKTMRRYKNFLIGLNLTIDPTGANVRKPTTVKWSAPADPGGVPPSWDETSAATLAGELPISEVPGSIIDGLQLGQSFMVYKENSVHRLDFVGGQSVFRQTVVDATVGLIERRCIANIGAGRQVFVSQNFDMYVTNGQTVQSLLDQRLRQTLAQAVDGEELPSCQLLHVIETKEVWFIFPEAGNGGLCVRALVWKYDENSFLFRSVPATKGMGTGQYDPGGLASSTWDSDTQVWNDDNTLWNESPLRSGQNKILCAAGTRQEAVWVNNGQGRVNATVGQPNLEYTSVIERTGLAIFGRDFRGQPKVDPKLVKLITAVYPIVETNDPNLRVQVRLGSHQKANGSISWGDSVDFDPTTETSVDVLIDGPFLAVRFTIVSSEDWEFRGYAMDIEPVGEVTL